MIFCSYSRTIPVNELNDYLFSAYHLYILHPVNISLKSSVKLIFTPIKQIWFSSKLFFVAMYEKNSKWITGAHLKFSESDLTYVTGIQIKKQTITSIERKFHFREVKGLRKLRTSGWWSQQDWEAGTVPLVGYIYFYYMSLSVPVKYEGTMLGSK